MNGRDNLINTFVILGKLKRKDSIGLHFSVHRKNDLACEVIFMYLGVKEEDISGFQLMLNNRVIIKFADHMQFEVVVKEYEEKSIDIGEDETVRVINLSCDYTYFL